MFFTSVRYKASAVSNVTLRPWLGVPIPQRRFFILLGMTRTSNRQCAKLKEPCGVEGFRHSWILWNQMARSTCSPWGVAPRSKGFCKIVYTLLEVLSFEQGWNASSDDFKRH